MSATAESREQILNAFEKLVKTHKLSQDRIELREEQAQRAKDRATAEKAGGYTVESIVKELADLQLSFGARLGQLATGLQQEADKVNELRRAIQVETAHLQDLKNIKVIADAAFIRTREMEAQRVELDERLTEGRQSFDEDVTEQRAAWTQEEEEHEAALAEYKAQQDKDREREQADHTYDIDRRKKIDQDNFVENKRQLELQLAEERARREKNWAEREEALAAAEAEHQDNLSKIAAFAAELEDAVNKAREAGIRKVNDDAKIEAALQEKEVAASTQVFELKIESLQNVINEQNTQIKTLLDQLSVALDRSQSLAVKAIEKSNDDASARRARKDED